MHRGNPNILMLSIFPPTENYHSITHLSGLIYLGRKQRLLFAMTINCISAPQNPQGIDICRLFIANVVHVCNNFLLSC